MKWLEKIQKIDILITCGKFNMKVIILAGGLGTRLSEFTKKVPKPMVKINNKPILIHIMNHYIKFGFKDFIIAVGYKANIIKEYFKSSPIKKCKVQIIDTGNKSMTGGRLKRLKKYLDNDTFMMTYGDGLSNVNLNKLYKFHKKNKKMITLTAVRPPARFGAIKLVGKYAKTFKEKSRLDEGWINGGYFVIEPKFLKLIKNDSTYLEKEPLETAAKRKQLLAFRHKDFWQCMDTKRDKDNLEKIFKNGKFF
jgi:glucose-1-phosphate cytidylyltransferase